MKKQNTISVCLAAILGFVLGAMYTHETKVKAQSGMRVYTTNVNLPGTGSDSIPSTQIVGFSCIEEHAGAILENPRCFIAYVK